MNFDLSFCFLIYATCALGIGIFDFLAVKAVFLHKLCCSTIDPEKLYNKGECVHSVGSPAIDRAEAQKGKIFNGVDNSIFLFIIDSQSVKPQWDTPRGILIKN